MKNLGIGFLVGCVFIISILWRPYQDLVEQSKAVGPEPTQRPKRYSEEYYEPSINNEIAIPNAFFSSAHSDPSIYTKTGGLRITTNETLLTLSHTDVANLCFNMIKKQSEIDTFELKVFLKPVSRAKLFSTIEQNYKKPLTFKLRNEVLATVVSTQPLFEDFKKNYELDASDVNAPLYQQGPELIFSANSRNKRAVMHLGQYLSNGTIPSGCDASFNPDKISWWPFGIQEFWQ